MKALPALLLVPILCTAGTPQLDDRAAWREACKLSGYSCAGIRRPWVAIAPLGDIYGRYYMGQQYILVHEDLTGNEAYAVRVHEMTHYLQWKHGKWTFTQENRCQMEHDAFDVSNTVLRRLGSPEDVIEWGTVREGYGCSV